jgi:hypothetical protein
MDAFAAQMTAEDEAAWPGFIDQAQFNVWLGEPFEEFINGLQSSADDALAADFSGVLWRNGHRNRIFVDVQTDVMHDFVHGCLVWLLCYQRPSLKPGL